MDKSTKDLVRTLRAISEISEKLGNEKLSGTTALMAKMTEDDVSFETMCQMLHVYGYLTEEQVDMLLDEK